MLCNHYQAIVLGASAGGFRALKELLTGLPASLPVPLLIVQHISPTTESLGVSLLESFSHFVTKEAEDKEILMPGTAYLAPPDYHLLVEKGATLALSSDEKENYSRPSIDVLFESAADAFHEKLIGVILTGASDDGARGLEKIKLKGGCTVAQDPKSAEFPVMPEAAIQRKCVDFVLPLAEIAPFLARIISFGEANLHG